ncbi:TerB family tellurite resistance protein [Chromobacterium piscinae]|uniref:TerB family tellurite resistance protein n=1 Tax=Chromobacterium piscinae TaxID=686831 RepID=UPI001E6029E1|nr:TerB family tellurite resistance protein [Chromobacterium piscinae]MCD5327437.1 TerB family tellurite resistance protein [Chromobacterium piscinae]
MRNYSQNSPEAIARLLAVFMIADGNMDPRELELLEKLHVYHLINLPRKQFAQVLRDVCDDISDEASDDGSIKLLERERIDNLLSDVTDRRKRILTCVLAMDISKSDGTISDSEMALLSHMMKSWGISLEDLEREFAR